MDVDKEIKDILKMKHNSSRDNRIYYLYQCLSYLLDSEQIDKETHDVYKKMIGYKPPFIKPSTIDCEDSLHLLTCLYEDVLNNASKYDLIKTINPHIEIEKYLPYVIEFFKYMGANEIYNNIINNNLLSLKSDLKNYTLYGSTYNLGNGKSAIIIKNGNDFRTLITLVHEIGHAYENYLKKDTFTRKYQYIDTECLSTTFEYLFIQFLKDNNLVDENILSIGERNNIIMDIWCMDNAYIYNNYTFNKKIIPNNQDIIIPVEIFNKLSIIKTGNYSLNKETQTCLLRRYRNYYSYGLLFAMVILERFKEDEHETKKFIQNFPKLLYYDIPNNHFGRDLIKLIPNDEYINTTNNYVDKVLSKK